jgi:uncharacterized cupin superfamily protein
MGDLSVAERGGSVSRSTGILLGVDRKGNTPGREIYTIETATESIPFDGNPRDPALDRLIPCSACLETTGREPVGEFLPPPNSVLHLTDMALDPLDAGVDAPPTRWREVGPLSSSSGDVLMGVWEMEPGVAFDTEVDEVFVVLSGRGEVRFLDSDSALLFGPGDLVRLAAGSRTRWTVSETVRKLYLSL